MRSTEIHVELYEMGINRYSGIHEWDTPDFCVASEVDVDSEWRFRNAECESDSLDKILYRF